MSQDPSAPDAADPKLQALREALARNQPDVVLELGMELGEQTADTVPILHLMREAVRRVISDLEEFGDDRRAFYRHQPEHYYQLADDIENELLALGGGGFSR